MFLLRWLGRLAMLAAFLLAFWLLFPDIIRPAYQTLWSLFGAWVFAIVLVATLPLACRRRS